MTVYELIVNLSKIAKANPDLEVEIHVTAEKWGVEAELSEDMKAGERIIVETDIDTYAEEFTVEPSNCGGHEKVCISASID